MANWWDELEVIGQEIKNGKNGKLLNTLVVRYRPYLKAYLDDFQYKEISNKKFRSKPIRLSERDFYQLCRSAVTGALAIWDRRKPLGFLVRNQFRIEYRRHVKLLERMIAKSGQDFQGTINFLIDVHSAQKINDPRKSLDDKMICQLIKKEIMNEKHPCPQIIFQRAYSNDTFYRIGIELRCSDIQCKNIYHRNIRSVRKRLLAKNPDIFDEF